jgi:hypothetical protein
VFKFETLPLYLPSFALKHLKARLSLLMPILDLSPLGSSPAGFPRGARG